MKLGGIERRLLLVIMVSTLAMAVASVAALRALDRIGAATEAVTGQDVPAVTAALRLAGIGERLQQRGASLMAAGTPEALAAAQLAIEADLAAFADQAEALESARSDPQWNTRQISNLTDELATRLADLRVSLDTRSRLAEALEAERARMLNAEERIRQLIGPSILAVEAITGGGAMADLDVYRTAVRSQAPLLAAERLTDQAMAELLLATTAETPEALEEIGSGHARTLAQLGVLVPSLPKGLRVGFQRDLAALSGQAGEAGILALRRQELDALAAAEAALADAGRQAAALKKAVDSRVIAASRSMAEVTEALRQTILSRTSQFTTIGLAVILMAGAVSYAFVIRPLARNLAGVTDAMTRLAAGEHDAQVPGAERHDEIGDLARAFTVFKDNSVHMEQLDRELTERSNLLLATFETMKDGFSVFDRELRLVGWNPQYLLHYEFAEADIRDAPTFGEIQRHLESRGVKAFLPDGQQIDLDALSHRRLIQPQRHELRFPDGRVLELRSNPIPQGGFATLHMDVTEQRATESQLLQSQKMESVGQLTGGIAHDFNNILAVIIGNLNILARETADTPALRARADRALGAADRAAGLVNRLLAFSRRQRLAPENVDLDALVTGMVDLLEASLGSGVTLRTDLGGHLPGVRVDPGALENALMNLAVNARDAMEGKGEISVATRAAGDDYVELSVRDTGEGIPPDLLDQVFEPFFTTKPAGKGSGLGLSMVYGFVRQSGGTVSIDSRPKDGTCVTLRLPVNDAASEPQRQAAGGSPDAAADACILAVDDDAELLEITADRLRQRGYAVVTAGDGRTALELLEEIPEIDLLYTDLAMPGGLDGIALARRAREMRPGLPVLYTSGAPGEAGAHLPNLLRKPVAEEVLATAVRVELEAQSRPTSASST
ncbi:ATP-binding protein [Tropicimonas isoalkanivorans]|uniref:histidine kinase n=1 Tax=Tropicimonas isoalkanivorans TaxID=441112 RepID=A0A1I1MRA9_9RHOB|nr:ATP-binding protein [Tropicimonas isoalkanivorans]SFC87977.1 His Kinase A (phospho-acceptor) domain-containing protein [Tropicimonas isoalkanivorans]